MVSVLAQKCIKQSFTPNTQLHSMMETFRQMVNECIRIGIENNKTSRIALTYLCYPYLKKYKQIDSRYRLCAISRACGILKNYNKLKRKGRNVRQPFCVKPMLTVCYGLRIKKGILHLPQKIRVVLNNHTLEVLSDPSLNMRSVTLSASTLSISVSKDAGMMECMGMLGVDRNLDNITMVDTDGNCIMYDMKKANEVKTQCKQIKRKFIRNDVRIRKLVFKKYGAIERNRVHWILHNVSKNIVRHARGHNIAIAMENIKGIRKLYRKGNGQGNHYRGRMNSWSYYELQRQIEYKALWEGIPVVYVNARGTSAKCSRCGDRMFPEENRMLRCASCKLSIDRDVNAARNILAKGMKAGLRFSPKGLPSEAMVAEPAKVICTVDGSQLSLGSG